MARNALISGALLMALGVLTGAFGAHIAQDLLSPARYEAYQTAVAYHFYHALGLLLLGVYGSRLLGSGSMPPVAESNATAGSGSDDGALRWFAWSVRLLMAGVLIFSGSLYLLTLTDSSWLGAVTPIGGVAFIAGWICFAVSIRKTRG